ncbi:DNA-directed RNA polymerase subunit beta' [Candidatus Vidania fulgoroideorum]
MKNFNKLIISFITSQEVLKLSSGEVKNSDTINYRTLKPEPDGLFCQKIFGPIKKNFCNCIIYKEKNVHYGKCKKCGVIINKLYLRRENIGHIFLQCKVFHIFIVKTIPYYLSLILDLKKNFVEKIVYYDIYLVMESSLKYIPVNTYIKASVYFKIFNKIEGKCKIKSGCDAICFLLNKINYKDEVFKLKKNLSFFYKNEKKRNIERYKILSYFLKKKKKIEDFMIDVLPVIPCSLRPIVKTSNKRFASSDLNELYATVINRNERLRKVNKIEAPEFILRTEKKLLQESVDCLFENGKKETFYKKNTRKPLKSISDNLKGKKGIFRNNLLGKRVDFSGRSVIVVEPNMKLDYCCIPIKIAMELFRPFVYRKLIKKYYCNNIIEAKQHVDVFSKKSVFCLKKIIKNKYIILNRAPTLHRLGIQSFKIILVKDRAIHIHPLVCSAYNADFDGDQMGVHIPLSKISLLETKLILKSTKNIISPANGSITILPTQDIILGIHYLTSENYIIKKKTDYFDNINDVINYYFINGEVNYCIYYKLYNGKFIKTSCRRVLIFKLLPEKKIYINYNKILYKSDIYNMIYYIYRKYNKKFFFKFIYKIVELGFYYATKSGISMSKSDLKFVSKNSFDFYIDEILKKLSFLKKMFGKGETFKKLQSKIFNHFYNDINKKMFKKISKRSLISNKKTLYKDNLNSLNCIYSSGSKGSEHQINQISGVRGYMMKYDGSLLKTPVLSNFYVGLNTDQYFLSSHGARKGLSDTSLKTADSGYLTRRLVDVSHDLVINAYDCMTKKSSKISINKNNYKQYLGYCIYSNIYLKKKVFLKKNSILNENILLKIIKKNISFINIRNPIFCSLKKGICSLCYGIDFSKNKLVDQGQAVGIIASQSIGEPGTQLTMRTFHTGGVYLNKTQSNNFFFNKYCFLNAISYNIFENKSLYYYINNHCKFNLVSLSGDLLFKGSINPGINFKKMNDLNFSIIKFSKTDSCKKCVINSYKVIIKYFNFENNYSINKKKNYTYFYISYNKIQKIPYIVLIKGSKNITCFLYNNYILRIKKRYKDLYDIKIYYYIYENYHKDITDSLDEVSNIFENRLSSFCNTIQYYDGILNFNKKGFFYKNLFLNRSYFIDTFSPRFLGKKNMLNKGFIISRKDYTLNDYLSFVGVNIFCNHFVKEISDIYNYHGISISRKHFEVILRKMINYVRLTKGDNINYFQNQIFKLAKFNKKKYFHKRYLYGITKSSLDSDSFISAASFQDTLKILLKASLYNKKDKLIGLKENVIVGKNIPAGTGYFFKN